MFELPPSMILEANHPEHTGNLIIFVKECVLLIHPIIYVYVHIYIYIRVLMRRHMYQDRYSIYIYTRRTSHNITWRNVTCPTSFKISKLHYFSRMIFESQDEIYIQLTGPFIQVTCFPQPFKVRLSASTTETAAIPATFASWLWGFGSQLLGEFQGACVFVFRMDRDDGMSIVNIYPHWTITWYPDISSNFLINFVDDHALVHFWFILSIRKLPCFRNWPWGTRIVSDIRNGGVNFCCQEWRAFSHAWFRANSYIGWLDDTLIGSWLFSKQPTLNVAKKNNFGFLQDTRLATNPCLKWGYRGISTTKKTWDFIPTKFQRNRIWFLRASYFFDHPHGGVRKLGYPKIIQVMDDHGLVLKCIETYGDLGIIKILRHLQFLGFSKETRPLLRSCPSWLFAAACAVSSGEMGMGTESDTHRV